MQREILIISNAMTETYDDGLVKLYAKTAEELKKKWPGSRMVSIGANCPVADVCFCSFFDRRFWSILKDRKYKSVLLMPRNARSALIWLVCAFLRLFFRKQVGMVIAFQSVKKMPVAARLIHPDLFIGSRDLVWAYRRYRGKIEKLEASVDLQQFTPVSDERKLALRKKYGLPPDRKILLHVGHAIAERGLSWMLKVPEDMLALFVKSTFQHPREDEGLKKQLEARGNVVILERYFSKIEELFQLSDCYVFTVQENGAINMPLSVFEAMACNLPVVAARFGELEWLEEGEGLKFVSGKDDAQTIAAAQALMQEGQCRNRQKAERYGWDKLAEKFQ